jgi:hypothetical protein
MKHRWGREEYTERCTRNEGKHMVWLKAGVWKLREI